MELEFDKYCVVDGSPTTVLPGPRHSSIALRTKSSEKVKCRNDLLSLSENFTEISFNRCRSVSCRVSRPTRANHDLHKRGSVYQSSKQVNLISKTDRAMGRQKIELSRETVSLAFPLEIIDSLCSSDEDGLLVDEDRSLGVSTSEQSTRSYSRNYSFSSKIGKKSLDSYNSNSQRERDPAMNLHKLLSSKLAKPHSLARSQKDELKINSPKAIFDPSWRKFDPSAKSRSQRSPLSNETSWDAGLSCSEPICKISLKDCPDYLNVAPPSSPAHLHGLLKSEGKNGLPFFEFSVNLREDVSYVAKMWKVNDALMWIYTFHSVYHKRKSNANGGQGFKGSNRESTLVAQMVVSCYPCTELKGAASFNASMAQEYVLYDIDQSRRSASSRDNSSSSPSVTKHPLVNNHMHNEISAKKMTKEQIFKHSWPLPAADLHPELEIAAVIMRGPFEKRESLKFKSGDGEMDRLLPSWSDLCRNEVAREGILGNSRPGEMHVVVPAGNHGPPSGENGGPSPLLDRWRSGGGCDCGGWDMACPLDIFVNPDFQICNGQPLVDDRHPVELFVQGKKNDNIPAFAMRAVEAGKYAIDFHAQLSSLQAFSICVAVLHAANTSTTVESETSRQMLQSDSLGVFAEEKVTSLMESISEEEKFKTNSKKDEDLPSFVINPPFSPIARV